MNKKVRAIIVGQGLAGTLLAWELIQRQHPFIIVASPHKSRASVVAAGMYNPLVFKRLTQSWMANELLPCMHATYSAIEKILQQKIVHPKNILKPLSPQEKDLWLKKQTYAEIAPYIASVRDESPIKSIHDFKHFGVVKEAGHVDTLTFLDASLAYFREQGYLIERDVEYADIKPSENSVLWNGINADYLIFCEGRHGKSNTFFNQNCYSLTKGELIEINAPQLSEDYIINRRVFVLPIGNHRFKVGSTYEWETIDELPTEEGKISIKERLDTLINVPYKIENHWAGVRPTIKDRRPLFGFHAQHKSLAIFNGLGTKGVMIGPYFSGLMADLLEGKQREIPKEVSISRFD